MNRFKVYCILLSMVTYLGMSQEYDTRLVQEIIEKEQLDSTKINYQLLVSKKLPYNDSIAVVVVPISYEDYYNDGYCNYDCYIYMINTYTNTIQATYYEENCWTSDAIYLYEIEVDTGLFILNEKTRAFGIKTKYRNGSQPNPYWKTNLTLFIQKRSTLVNILDVQNYLYHGEWDTNCSGLFETENTIIIVDKTKKRNGFYNLKIKTTQFETVLYIDKKTNDCEEKNQNEKTTINVLTYNGTTYQ